jgi:hypothetical protein
MAGRFESNTSINRRITITTAVLDPMDGVTIFLCSAIVWHRLTTRCRVLSGVSTGATQRRVVFVSLLHSAALRWPGGRGSPQA